MAVQESSFLNDAARAARSFEQGLVKFYNSFASASQWVGEQLLKLTKVIDIAPTILTEFVVYAPRPAYTTSGSGSATMIETAEKVAKMVTEEVLKIVPGGHGGGEDVFSKGYEEFARKIVERTPGDVLLKKEEKAALAIVNAAMKVVGFIEDKVINGIVNSLAKGASKASQALHRGHKGELGWYQAFIVIGAAAIAAFFAILLALYGGV